MATIQEALQNAVNEYNLWCIKKINSNLARVMPHSEFVGIVYNKLMTELKSSNAEEILHGKLKTYLYPTDLICTFDPQLSYCLTNIGFNRPVSYIEKGRMNLLILLQEATAKLFYEVYSDDFYYKANNILNQIKTFQS